MFELVDGIPKPSQSNVATNTIKNPIQKRYYDNSSKILHNQMSQSSKELKNVSNFTQCNTIKKTYYDSNENTRMDFYYFDHGNSQ